MAHSVRRRIIDCLLEQDLSFLELLNAVGDGDHGKFGFHLRTLKDFVELHPSTKKYRLTSRGDLLGAVIHDFRFLVFKGKETERYVRLLKFGDHAVLTYDDEGFRRRVAFSFLRAGLSRNEAVMYVVSEHEMDSEIRAIQRSGVDLDSLPMEAFTLMSAYEWYLSKGKAQPKVIVGNWKKFINSKKRDGFAGVRVASDMSVFFENAKSKELFRYEESLGRQFALDLCALCIYDMNRLNEKQLIRLYNCHGYIISKDFLGKIVA